MIRFTYICTLMALGMLMPATMLTAPGGSGSMFIEALAQTSPNPRETGAETVRRRQQELEAQEGQTLTGKYWTPFELARAGRCDEALPELQTLAERGRGFENAQHVYGLCLLETGSAEDGREWVRRAAEAGLADAQASHLRAYLADGTDYLTHDAAAKWLYLYQTNPLRLAIGTEQALEPEEIDQIRTAIPRADYLKGVEAARRWTPTFWTASQTTDLP